MDTKWRGFSPFNGLKFVLILLMVASTLVMVPCLSYVNNVVSSNFSTYDKTYQFEERFNRLVHNVVEYHVILKGKDHIESSKEEISKIESQLSEYSVLDNESTNSFTNEQSDSVAESKAEGYSSNKERLLQRLYTIEEHLESNVNFIYYIVDTKTGAYFTNIEEENPIDFMKNQNSYVQYNQYQAQNNQNFNYNDDILRMLKGTDYEVHGALYRSLRIGDEFFIENAQFDQLMKNYPGVRLALILSSCVFLLTFIILAKLFGRDSQGQLVDSSFDKIYNEIKVVLALILILLTVVFIEPIGNIFLRSYDNNIFYLMSLSEYFCIALITNILILLGMSLLKEFKRGSLIKNTFLYKAVTICFQTKYFKPGIILIFMAYVFINAILGVVLFASINGGGFALLIAFLVFISFNIGAFAFLLRSLQSLNKIMEITKQVSRGDFQDVVHKDQISLSFRDFYTDIISIKEGMKNAVQEAIKGERLKTELITNVSHDLKTPLTSIINYVDLLKREELEDEKAREYISVLDEKSGRLKQLVDDLLEASKASSGNLNLELQTLDFNELIQQGLGEVEDKFEDTNVMVKVNIQEENLPIKADSKHMWRVVENLLTNASKYAMPHTRVYIETCSKDDYGILTIKNVSAQPLDISPDELTQRFVRGDESRTTEGSGLGLSIAESLVKIQGGKFTIDIDGDLFKVSVAMPLTVV